MSCEYCELSTHFMCMEPDDDFSCCCSGSGGLNLSTESKVISTPGAKQKSGDELVNVLAAGRARAAQLIVFDKKNPRPCTWAGLKYAGGGVNPIVGCNGLPAKARHHGPDKSVLNNEVGVNLHEICTYCHKRWHARNDPHFTLPRPDNGETWLPNKDWQPHDPDTIASDEDKAWAEYERKIIREASRHNKPELLKLLYKEDLTADQESAILDVEDENDEED